MGVLSRSDTEMSASKTPSDLHFRSLAFLMLPWPIFAYAVLAAEEAGLLLLSTVTPSSRWSSCSCQGSVRAEEDKASSTALALSGTEPSARNLALVLRFAVLPVSLSLHVFVTRHTPLRHELPEKLHFSCGVTKVRAS